MKRFLFTIAMLWTAICLHAQPHRDLMPAPLHLVYNKGRFLLRDLSICMVPSEDTQVRFALNDFVDFLESHTGFPIKKRTSFASSSLQFTIQHKGYELPGYDRAGDQLRESYSLRITPNHIFIESYAATGLYYAFQTLKQMLQSDGKNSWIPLAELSDKPAILYRGVMMDFAHGGLLRIDEIKRQMDFLAKWKTNQYYFYNEVSIQMNGYAGLQYKQSYSQSEIRELVEYGRQRHMDVIPFVAFYGHLHDLLKNESYASLAIGNYGHELDPRNSRVSDLLLDWIRQYAGIFHSPFIHVGFDETWETNRISSEKDSTIDPEKLWLNQLNFIRDQLKKTGKMVMAWTDMSSYYPDILSRFPNDVIPVIWEYAPDSTALYHYLDPVLRTGRDFFIQPAVSGWGHIYPAADYTYDNIDLCLREGLRHHTLGFITSVWTDAVEPFVRPSWSFMAYGCVSAWQGTVPDRHEFEQQLYPLFLGVAPDQVRQACSDLAAATSLLQKCFGANTSNMPGGTIIESWSNPFGTYYLNIARSRSGVLKQVRLLCEEAENLLVSALPMTAPAEKDFVETLRVTARLMHYEATRFLWANVICSRWDEAMLVKKRNNFVFYDLAYLCHGLIQDLMDELGSLKDDYSAAWLSEYQPYRRNTIIGRFDVEYGLWQKLLLKLIDYRIQHTAEFVAPRSFVETFHPDF